MWASRGCFLDWNFFLGVSIELSWINTWRHFSRNKKNLIFFHTTALAANFFYFFFNGKILVILLTAWNNWIPRPSPEVSFLWNCFIFILIISILLRLNEGLALLHNTLESLAISKVTAQQLLFQLERSERDRRTNLVKLQKDITRQRLIKSVSNCKVVWEGRLKK
jgi:hypothetical protein